RLCDDVGLAPLSYGSDAEQHGVVIRQEFGPPVTELAAADVEFSSPRCRTAIRRYPLQSAAGSRGKNDRSVATPTGAQSVRGVTNVDDAAAAEWNLLQFPVGEEADPFTVSRKKWADGAERSLQYAVGTAIERSLHQLRGI